MEVKELMRTPYVTDKDISLIEAASLMSKKSIGSLLFVTKGKLKGIITETDLVKNFAQNKTISQIMSKNIITANSNNSLDDALELMRSKKIKRLPVVDNGKLVGIITLTDIAANADELEGDFFF